MCQQFTRIYCDFLLKLLVIRQRISVVCSKKKQDDDLDLLEISAAMGLATMKQNNSHKQGRGAASARQ
jgi:hypothetical protein